jgi:hypothetical protein
MYQLAEHFGAEQQTTKLLLGNKSERAQKIFALDYCSGAFVTEGAALPPLFSSRPERQRALRTWAALLAGLSSAAQVPGGRRCLARRNGRAQRRVDERTSRLASASCA